MSHPPIKPKVQLIQTDDSSSGQRKGLCHHAILMTAGVWISLAIAMSGPLPAGEPQPEWAFVNGQIITVDQASSVASALAVRGSQIVAVGTDDEVLETISQNAVILDLQGKSVIPGLIDGHPHLDGAALASRRLSFAGARSIPEVLELIQEEVQRHPPGTWIVTEPLGEPPFYFGLPELLAENRYPNRWDLDRVSPEHPVYITGIGLRKLSVSIANSLALQTARITRDTKAPVGATIVHDENGEPTGVFEERIWPPVVQSTLFSMIPAPSLKERKEAIREAVKENARFGLTGIYEGHGISPESLIAYIQLKEANELPLRVYGNIALNPNLPLDETERILNALTPLAGRGLGDDWFRIGGIALSYDGAAATGSALMRNEYVGQRGELWQGDRRIPKEKFRAIVEAAARKHLRVQTQSSGGLAIDEVLKIYEDVAKRYPVEALRWTIIHSQFPTAENMETARRLKLAVTTCTTFLHLFGKDYLEFYGSEVAHQSIPVKSWLRAGVPLSLGSDRRPTSPIFGLWQTTVRKDARTGFVLGPDERVSLQEALRTYSINGAYAMFLDDKTGSLEVGKQADLVVLSGNLLNTPVDEVRELTSLLTMVGGLISFHDTEGLPLNTSRKTESARR